MGNYPRRLFGLRLFWCAVLIPLIFSILSFVFIIISSELKFSAGYGALNNAIDIFRVPLSLLAIIFPLVALVAANHRSVLTLEQISSTNKKNVFDNYYRHLEVFERYFDKRHSFSESGLNVRRLHCSAFGTVKDFSYEFSTKFIFILKENLDDILYLLKQDEMEDLTRLNLMLDAVRSTSACLCLDEDKIIKPIIYTVNDEQYEAIESFEDIVNFLKVLLSILHRLEDFIGESLDIDSYEIIAEIKIIENSRRAEPVECNKTTSISSLGILVPDL